MTDRKEVKTDENCGCAVRGTLPLQPVHLQELQLLNVRDRRRPRPIGRGRFGLRNVP